MKQIQNKIEQIENLMKELEEELSDYSFEWRLIVDYLYASEKNKIKDTWEERSFKSKFFRDKKNEANPDTN